MLLDFFRRLFGRKKEDRDPITGGKALIVAVNDYPSAPLQGCIQDASDFQLLWMDTLGIDQKCIRMLLNKDATTANYKDALRWLADVKDGQFALHHFSGHGVQTPGPEADGLCEATCLTGDTKIPLADGREVTIETLCASGEKPWVYSVDKDGNIKAGKVSKVWKTSSCSRILKVTLDNNESVRCTPNHPWMMRDGTYKKAIDLKPGDSLMPLYRQHYIQKSRSNYKYEMVFNPSTNEYQRTHKVFAGSCPSDVLAKSKEQGCGVVVHHSDFDSRNNSPENLKWMSWKDHQLFHKASPEGRKKISENSRRMWADPETRKRLSEIQVLSAKKRWESLDYRKKISAASKRQDHSKLFEGLAKYNESIGKEKRFGKSSHAGKFNKGVKKSKEYVEMMKQRWKDPEYREKMRKAQSEAMKRRWADSEERKKLHTNHKVASVEEAGLDEVFDMSVPEFENFAICAGVFLHNCPYDFDWSRDRMMKDDDYFKLLWEIPDSVRFYWTSDSCHSGDLTRDMPSPRSTNRSMPLPPHMLALVANLKARKLLKPLITTRRATELDVGFVSACQSNQTASDTVIDGKACGAFSHFFCERIRKDAKNPLVNVVAQTVQDLSSNGYSQIPHGEGPRIKYGYFC